ncbi:MAG: mdtN [Planctomycetaceae bacterium]|nr:mdtN [Planctomycetaceae bacterium]
MKTPRSAMFGQLAFIGLILLQSSWLLAQDVTIKREPIVVSDPKGYQVPLRTVPVKLLEITAPADGIVRQVLVKPGAKALAQTEAIRLDDDNQKLVLERAKAHLQAAKIELKIAQGKKEADLEELANAHIAAADADLKLAELQLNRVSIKLPFVGEVLKVDVVPGQFVRTGERLLTLIDSTTLTIEVPVDRSKVKAGAEIEISIEKTPVKAKVQVILPADRSFEPLRTLINNLATAVVQVENPKNEFFAGQSVFTKVIPQQAFGHIPTIALQNTPEGVRKVQVLRQGIVRDVPVQELTQMGAERLFVAGAFAVDDEVIVSTSQPLRDGQIVKQKTVATAKAEGETEEAKPGAVAAPKKPAVSF